MNLALSSSPALKTTGLADPSAKGDHLAGELSETHDLGLAGSAADIAVSPEAEFSAVLAASTPTLPQSSEEVGLVGLTGGALKPNTELPVGEVLPDGGKALPLVAGADLSGPTSNAPKPEAVPVFETLQPKSLPSLAAAANGLAANPAAVLDTLGDLIPVSLASGAAVATAIGEGGKSSDKTVRSAAFDMLAGQNSLLASVTSASLVSGESAGQQGQASGPTGAGAASAAPTAATSGAIPSGDGRAAAALEQAIDQLTQTREAGRTSRPEILMRHAEFGLVSMRIDGAAGDMRATLSNRDPGFVPAVQAMLAERGVSAASETNTANQRGSEGNQSQNGQPGQSQREFGATGSSAGSEQGFAEQGADHSEQGDELAAVDGSETSAAHGTDPARDSGLFA